MISFQIVNAGEIMVYCDSDGLDKWINTLICLRSSPDGGHIHMRSPLSGGEHLSDQNPWGEKAVGEVVITVV